MNEFVKTFCACDEGYDKGAFKATVKNITFTVFGNVVKDGCITIRYHGDLTLTNTSNKNTDENILLYYAFDNDWKNKATLELNKCHKVPDTAYCGTINLGKHNKISFEFCNKKGDFDLDLNKPFELEILKDPITNIMQRYGFEQNKELPIVTENKDKYVFPLWSLLQRIKLFFTKELFIQEKGS